MTPTTTPPTSVSSLHKTKACTPRKILQDEPDFVVVEGHEAYDNGAQIIAFWFRPPADCPEGGGFPTAFGRRAWSILPEPLAEAVRLLSQLRRAVLPPPAA
jgi:hypothetical protein